MDSRIAQNRSRRIAGIITIAICLGFLACTPEPPVAGQEQNVREWPEWNEFFPDLDTAIRAPGLRKTKGGTNGDADYCNIPAAAQPVCGGGEGDCDSDIECTTGFCGTDNGGLWNQPQTNDVCVPATCFDRVQNNGETGSDCGGPCGVSCTCRPTLPDGHRDRCSYACKCPSNVGDCDANEACITGFCGSNNGALFGMPADADVCTGPTCQNRVLDARVGESGVDCGGPCPACPAPPRQLGTLSFAEPGARVERAVDDASGIACLALGPAGMRCADVTNPSAPIPLGGWTPPGGSPANCTDIVKDGNYVYLACDARFVILDVSTPASPTLVSSIPTVGAHSCAKIGDALYISEGTNVRVYNVSNPAAPTQGTVLGMGSTMPIVRVYVDRERIYSLHRNGRLSIATAGGTGGGTHLVPVFLDGFGGGLGFVATDLAVRDGIAYCAFNGRGLYIYDVSNASRPIQLFSDRGSMTLRIDVRGTTLARVFSDNRVSLESVVNSRAPFLLATTVADSAATAVGLLHGEVALVGFGNALSIYDIPPYVVSTSPSANSTGACPGSAFEVFFNTEIAPSSLSPAGVRLLNPGLAVVPGNTVLGGARSARITPSGPMPPGEYRFSLSSSVQNTRGTPLAPAAGFSTGFYLGTLCTAPAEVRVPGGTPLPLASGMLWAGLDSRPVSAGGASIVETSTIVPKVALFSINDAIYLSAILPPNPSGNAVRIDAHSTAASLVYLLSGFTGTPYAAISDVLELFDSVASLGPLTLAISNSLAAGESPLSTTDTVHREAIALALAQSLSGLNGWLLANPPASGNSEGAFLRQSLIHVLTIPNRSQGGFALSAWGAPNDDLLVHATNHVVRPGRVVIEHDPPVGERLATFGVPPAKFTYVNTISNIFGGSAEVVVAANAETRVATDPGPNNYRTSIISYSLVDSVLPSSPYYSDWRKARTDYLWQSLAWPVVKLLLGHVINVVSESFVATLVNQVEEPVPPGVSEAMTCSVRPLFIVFDLLLEAWDGGREPSAGSVLDMLSEAIRGVEWDRCVRAFSEYRHGENIPRATRLFADFLHGVFWLWDLVDLGEVSTNLLLAHISVSLNAPALMQWTISACEGDVGCACCSPGAVRCSASGDVETCQTDGCTWLTTQSCTFGCTGGECTGALCTPGAIRCNGSGDLETCAPDGSGWSTSQACPCGCAAARCTDPTCTPGTDRCGPSGDVDTCQLDGCGWITTQNCACGCAATQCLQGACTPGSTRCSPGGDVETCQSDGCRWVVTDNCACGCSGGGCTPATCTPGTRACNANGDVETCQAGGCSWQVSVDCIHGTCSGGVCVCDAGYVGTDCSTRCGNCGEPCCSNNSCSGGLVCSGGICSDGCSPENQLRCTGGERERCSLIFGCRRWIPSSCGWDAACCSQQGDFCQSTTFVPASPTLLSPSPGGIVVQSNASFSWSAVPGAYRYKLAVCSGPNLGGTCQIIEDGLVGVTLYGGPITTPRSETGSWSVRAVTHCDFTQSGYSPARQVAIR